MNTEKLTTSTPYTIQNYDNYLKDYVNLSGFKYDTNCLELALKNLGDEFDKYVQKIGDYNTIAAWDPQYTPPRSWQEKDYAQSCPENWTYKGYNGGCVNQSYTGKCNAGRTTQTKRTPSCPSNSSGQSFTNYPNWVQVTRYHRWWFVSIPYNAWELRWNSYNNSNYYNGWNGPTDIGYWNLCRANVDYSRSGSLSKSRSDCQNSGNHSSGSDCYIWPKYDNTTESPSWFNGYSNDSKRNWENECQAYWPMKTINIPEKWTCQYGDNIWNDIGRGYLKQLPLSVSSKNEAAKEALKSNELNDNYFAIIDNSLYIVGKNSNINVITSKGAYQQNCTENNNRKISLYYINQSFFNLLEECKVVNDKINDVNTSRNILQSSITSIRENFESGFQGFPSDIINNQNEITKNLISNYNKKAELYNYQVGLIGQNEKLVEDHNKKLNMQLDELSLIQDQIALKDRVIVLNDELSKKQIRNKKILIGFFVIIPLLAIPLILITTKAVNSSIGFGIGVAIIVGYIIYIIVILNQKDVKNFGKENKNIISKYETAIANYWNKQKEKLSSSLNNFVNEKCANSQLPEIPDSGSGSGGSKTAYPKGDYLMKSNGPFYYYDGSAPPQQIHPGATGSINFSIEGENQKFPNIDLSKIKNPITKFFFQTWLAILNKNGIKLDDPRFNEILDVIDFPDSDQTPMPFWDNIKLPIVTNINQQFNYLFQSYNGKKKNLSQTASVLLIDLWNFIFGDKIPNDIYDSWVNKLADVVKQSTPNIEKFYEDYLKYIMGLTKFTEKYGSGDVGLNRFVEIKMVDFIKTFNQDISVSQPFAKRYVP
jgi:hypothetical protein